MTSKTSDPGSLVDGILRNAHSKDGLVKYPSAGDSIKTLYDTFQHGVARNPSSECLGKRNGEDSPYVYKSYGEIQAEAAALGSFLVELGVQPNDRVGISGKNAPEYLTTILGCFHSGITTVPIYDTFGKPECQYIMEQSKVKVVFVDHENCDKIVEWSKNFNFIMKIVVWGAEAQEKSAQHDNSVTYASAVETGKSSPKAATPPSPDDLAIIMYTSGTTGKPKGVMHPHSVLVATIASVESYFGAYGYQVSSSDVYMSYLPLAHVFDFFAENLFLFSGAKIGYYRGDQKTLVNDIEELKPTIFVGVPRVFERIYKRVDSMIQGGSPMKRMLFKFFYESKRKALSQGVAFDQASFLGDMLVFNKIKNRLGGKVRIICSGGAPLPVHVEEWLKVTMCCPIVQGYGLTETCGASCIALPDRKDQLGTVGPPLFSLEVKLDPVPDIGYDGTADGGGEICFRGPSVMKGYYQNPTATSEALDKDGWFHTGDIGKIVSGGCLKIVDRKKQLFKLSQGEYVSPEKVEGIAAKSHLVAQIFVHGTSTESSLVAIIVPSTEAFKKYGGKKLTVESDQLRSDILKDIDRVCRAEKLKGYEIPKGIFLFAEEFTVENGFMTPKASLKRPQLKKHFADEIAAMYASLKQ